MAYRTQFAIAIDKQAKRAEIDVAIMAGIKNVDKDDGILHKAAAIRYELSDAGFLIVRKRR